MTDLPIKKGGRRTYSPDQIDRVLIALILCGGSTRQAERMLKAEGFPVPEGTIRNFRDKHHGRYVELRATRTVESEKAIVDQLMTVIAAAAEVELAAIELEAKRVKDGTVRDAAASAKAMSLVKAIGIDKIRVMTDRPTAIIEARTGDDVLAKLDRMGLLVDSDAEVVSEAPPAPPKAIEEHA